MKARRFPLGIAVLISCLLHFSFLAFSFPGRKERGIARQKGLKARLIISSPAPKPAKALSPPIKKPAPKKDAFKPEQSPETEKREDFSPEAEKSSSELSPDEFNRYLAKVISQIQRAKHYPFQARKKKQEGEVRVRFVIRASGELEEAEVIESSGYEILDQQALKILKRASPFPPFPSELKEERLELKLKVVFRLQD